MVTPIPTVQEYQGKHWASKIPSIIWKFIRVYRDSKLWMWKWKISWKCSELASFCQAGNRSLHRGSAALKWSWELSAIDLLPESKLPSGVVAARLPWLCSNRNLSPCPQVSWRGCGTRSPPGGNRPPSPQGSATVRFSRGCMGITLLAGWLGDPAHPHGYWGIFVWLQPQQMAFFRSLHCAVHQLVIFVMAIDKELNWSCSALREVMRTSESQWSQH